MAAVVIAAVIVATVIVAAVVIAAVIAVVAAIIRRINRGLRMNRARRIDGGLAVIAAGLTAGRLLAAIGQLPMLNSLPRLWERFTLGIFLFLYDVINIRQLHAPVA